VRAAEWRISPVPADLADRRVEITGPVDRKMVINALNAPCRRSCGLRGLLLADLGKRDPRPGEPHDAVRRTISTSPRRT